MLAPVVGAIAAFAMAAYSWYKFEQMADHPSSTAIRQWAAFRYRPPARHARYQTNLFWGAIGSLGIFISTVGAVVAAVLKDPRWLLWGAAPFGLIGVWAFARLIPVRGWRWTTVLAGVAAVGGTLLLVNRIISPQSYEAHSGCEIKKQTEPLRANPMPSQATDYQLSSEVLKLVENTFHLTDVYLDVSKKYDPDKDEIACGLLQEYESKFKVPALAVQRAILDRLPIEDQLSIMEPKIIRAL